MATIAGPGALRPAGGGGGGGGGPLKVGASVRRKTPSELRGEQLKRANAVEVVGEDPAPSVGPVSSNNGAIDILKKPGVFKPPRYIDMRVDEVYPAKKSRLKMISAKENTKENYSDAQTTLLGNISPFSRFAARRKQQFTGQETSTTPLEISDNVRAQACQMTEEYTQSRFRDVAEISSSGQKLSIVVDMDKALKGLAAQERSSGLAVDSSVASRCPPAADDFHHQGISLCKKTPIDLTLKTMVRFASSSPLHWIYKSIMHDGYESVHRATNSCCDEQRISSSLGIASTSSNSLIKALHSWIYPSSSLPTSLISVLISSAAEKGEMDFLEKRKLGWEESFQSLYYMLRKRACHIFYVCTSQFVVMFTGIDESGKAKHTCNAYISRSTSGLRSLLREHGVCFSMPLCLSKVEQVATEDLIELSVIEKHNLGQARRCNSSIDIDNIPQSLLALRGNKNVHGLYDLLLNYRSFMTFLTGEDVPVLYSPVQFRNATLSIPELLLQVRCIEMKRGECIADSFKGPIQQGADPTFLGNSLEIKDAYLPPWIVCNLCELVGSCGSFEASFVTEGTSIGLNAALASLHEESNLEDPKGRNPFGISEALVNPLLRSGSLKSLKFCNDSSYTASLSSA